MVTVASVAGKTRLPVGGYRIPLIFYAPKLVAPGEFTPTMSQIDLPPTIVDVLRASGTTERQPAARRARRARRGRRARKKVGSPPRAESPDNLDSSMAACFGDGVKLEACLLSESQQPVIIDVTSLFRGASRAGMGCR